jgi:L-2-hydroxyglutarate oxidase LhgO
VVIVVGGGVSGLAVALSLASRGRAVAVLERHARAGVETSTHNSGVIHAGLYHPAASLKTQLCVEGRERLLAFAASHGVPAVRCGKLIVAQAGEGAALEALARNARANGVPLEPADAAFVRRREPHVRASSAAWSPLTGWVDAHAYVQALTRELVRLDVPLLIGTSLVAVEHGGDTVTVVTTHERIDNVEVVVNAAGLWADDVARACDGEPFAIYPCRGEYAELAPSSRRLINGLVYPVPHASGHGLGVHFTRTLGGEVWIGPTIEYRDRKDDYESGRIPLERFLEPSRMLLPAIELDDLRLGSSGIRAKLHPPSESFADFMIRTDARQPWLFHVAGIDSPGLTASLAIGEFVATALTER